MIKFISRNAQTIPGNNITKRDNRLLGRAAAKLEMADIPTVLLGRTDFLGVVRNAVSRRKSCLAASVLKTRWKS